MSDVILITGVGKRLGFELATHFLELGTRVVGTYRTEHEALDFLRAAGADLHQVDFYQPSDTDRFIGHIQQEYRLLRAVIHNASDWLPDNTGGISPAEIMNRMMTIHASVPYQLNMAFQQQLTDGEGDIIHIGDFVAEKGSSKHIAYAASKAAQNNLTLSFAALMAPEVKVNSISPALLKFNEGDDEAYKMKALSKALIKREAGFDEIIRSVEFILESRYMTGRNIQMDGGRHLK